jgi:polyphosphate glucokinase
MTNHVLGIDIGGTGIKGAPVDLTTGTLLAERFRIPTPQPATPEAMAATAHEIVKHFDWKGDIGIGFPAVVKNGVVRTAGNIDKSWIGCDGKALFEKEFGLPVTMVNDADAAGYAEMAFGAGKDVSGSVLIVTLGTGIGTAMFLNGKLFPNTELGHMIIREKDAELRASASARERNEWSWKKWGANVSEYLSELHRLLWCDLFIIGGGASNKWEKMAPHVNCPAEVVPAKLANLAGIVGAAMAARADDSAQPKPKPAARNTPRKAAARRK